MTASKENVFRFSEYQSVDQLPINFKKLALKAIEAQQTSYSPYSNFAVGAAVLLENGEVVQGSNQENGAFPSGLCAERVALFYAGSKFPGVKVLAIAIAANFKGKGTSEPISPCGACRQVMLETRNNAQHPMAVIMVGEKRTLVIDDSLQLLPFSFSKVDEAIK
jgi:cytidine deaminase